MSRPFIPRPYQDIAVRHLMTNRRCALWAEMGMGKSASVIAALEKLDRWIEDVYPVLIVAPLRVARDTWPAELRKWTDFNHLKISPVIGDLDQRMAALKTPAHIYSINIEQIPWLVQLYGSRWPWKTIVMDEATRLAGFRSRQGTVRSKALYQVAWPHCNRFWELSGKPAPGGLQSLWGPMAFLDKGQRLGTSFSAFSQRWFSKSWDGFGLDPLPFAQDQIQNAISDICLSIRAEDWFDIKKPIENTLYITLPPAARKLYNQMEKELFMEIKEHGVEAFNAGGKRGKMMQLVDGVVYLHSDEEKRLNRPASKWEEVHDEKCRALESIIEEANGEHILVSYHFRSDLERLSKRFPQATNIADTEGLDLFMKGRKTVGLAHPASMGHGIDGLQNVCHRLTYFSHNDNLDNHDQILGRIGPVRQIQAGFHRPVFVNHIVAKDTVEEYAVIPNLEGKGSIQTLLMAAMRRIGNEL